MKKNTIVQTNILFYIAGGIGKNVAATSVVESLKAAYPKSSITIATAYPFVWDNNPHVFDAYDLNANMSGFYQYHLSKGDWTILKHEPYFSTGYLKREKHLIDEWCELIGIESKQRQPSLYLTDVEIENVKELLPNTTKPLFFIQTNGGAQNQRFPISWARDLPLEIAQTIVDTMNEKGFETIHIRRMDQPQLENVTWLNGNPREIMAALTLSSKRLLIDSFPQHAAAALSLPSVVAWIVNSPETFGYDIHTNILARKQTSFRHYPDSYFEKFDITGAISQCPYDTDEIFNASDILKILVKQN